MLVDNYFVGLVILYSQGNTNIMRRILKWKFLDYDNVNNLQFFYCHLDGDLTDSITNTSTSFTIYNPSTIPGSGAFLFLPASEGVKNFYNGYVIWNQTVKNYATIDDYDGVSHIAHVSGTSLGWNLNHIYVLRRKPPVLIGSLSGVLPGFSNSVNIGVNSDVSFINSFMRLYNSDTSKIVKRIVAIIGKNKDGNYTKNLNDIRVLEPYVILEDTFGLPAAYATNLFEILQYTMDNSVPFVYSGSMISATQASAQELTLNTLILPNVNLANGGKIWGYPFVYVEIENVSTSSSGTRNVIFSNNPNSYKAVFKVPIINISNPEQYAFINLSGNGVKQVINFKQNADVKITVRLPNGTVFQTLTPETPDGAYPNQFLQISALFGMEKI
jgi:hypothetical protein